MKRLSNQVGPPNIRLEEPFILLLTFHGKQVTALPCHSAATGRKYFLPHSLFLRTVWEAKQCTLGDNVMTNFQACDLAEVQFQQKCGQKCQSQLCMEW